ncbi:MAG: methyltransferase domain-containing protein [Chloroflexi bacterium]|nr:methyltransferase domain-containing protein [Chloroflexota bacterium]
MLSLDRQNSLREQYRAARPDWRPATEVYADLVRAQLRPSSRVLDVGCGRGGLVEQLTHPLAQMAGIDPDWRSLREHRLELPRAAAFSDAIPFRDRSFDVAFSSWLLEHLERPSHTFSEISRVLRPSGAFVFITPNKRHPLSALNRGLGRFARLQGRIVQRFYGRASTDAFPTFYRANETAALHQLCQSHNLRLAELHAIPDPTYLAFTPALFRLMSWFEGKLPEKRRLHLVGLVKRDT